MDKKTLCKSPNKKICGVCAGLADYFNIDPTLVRICFFALTYFSLGITVLVYFIMAIAMENPPINYSDIYQNTAKKITKSQDKRICGVCGGIAQRMNIDPLIIRLIWGILTVVTIGLPGVTTYIVASWIMPEPDVIIF